MKDFDDHIAEQLDREGQFPNRSRNWRALSKRLDALDLGGRNARPKLRLWQAIAAVAAISAGWLFWENMEQKQENTQLRQEIAQILQNSTVEPNTMASSGFSSNHAISPASPTNESLPPALTQSVAGQSRALATLPKASRSVLELAGRQAPDLAIPPAGAEYVLAPSTENIPAFQAEQPAIKTDTAQGTEITEAPLPEPPDTTWESGKPQAMPPAEAVQAPEVAAQNTPAPLPVIDPVKKPMRFKVGPYAVVGFVQPKPSGISTIKGQGIAADFKLMRNWWLSASAEWLRYEICSVEFPEKFYPHKDSIPKPPGGPGGPGGPHKKLSLVESSQRMQQYGVGLRYEIPVRWWFRPAVRATYNWVRTAPTLVTYQFRKDEPQGGGGPMPKPEYFAEKNEAHWQQDQWEFGVGLEKDLPRWTFGLWADYAKSLSPTTPAFDALYVRGGLQYRF